MLVTTHAFAGLALATVVQNPMYLIPISFTSHFILDYIPHTDPKNKDGDTKRIYKFFTVDFSIYLLMCTLVLYLQNPLYFVAMVASTVMDLDVVFHLKERFPKPIPKKLSRIHKRFHNEAKTIKRGLVYQGVCLLFFAAIVFVSIWQYLHSF